ncbi:MAG: glycoside hydrolase family 11 protein [Ruminococcus sp.]|uniref:glycoside hydrolase family 11 protein n=1 Tax=Ruminococcus sp. TaxID=41978 RepID=UPI0025E196D9|nr:glycoside hydrolase family 11 protein [Ruminococcus sp.]MCR5599341.1 glycoside hydrolase family 11 protein [Ruminococcus sp.]
MLKLLKKVISFTLAASLSTAGIVYSFVNAEEADNDTTVLSDTVVPTENDDDGFISGAVNYDGNYALYDYGYWNDSSGSIKMTPGMRGSYDCYWRDVTDCLFKTGEFYQKNAQEKRKILGSPVSDYKAVMDPASDYYFGAYGWFTDPYVEFFIIDDWGINRPTFKNDPIAKVELDGGEYEIYIQPLNLRQGLASGPIVYRYYSVRTEKRSAESNIIEGKISIGMHLEALKKAGAELGDIYQITLAVEGLNSSGSAHILKNDLYSVVTDKDVNVDINPDYEDQWQMPDENTVDVLHDTVFNDLVTDERDGYYFNLYKDFIMSPEVGETKLELLKGGAFKCEWENNYLAKFSRGLQYYNSENANRSVVRKYNNEELTIEYGVDLESEGASWAGGYGWLNTLKTEYFIVEAWKDWHITDDAVHLGSVSLSNDAVYDLYEVPDNGFFNQIWSVRRDNQLDRDGKAEGTINLNDHFYAWKKYALDVVDPDYVTFTVSGLQSSGKAEVYKNTVKINGEDIYYPSNQSDQEIKPAPKYVPGDLNGDLIVNSFDVVIARRELVKAVNGESTIDESDIDCSGDTRINDLVLITKLALGEKVVVPRTRPKHS